MQQLEWDWERDAQKIIGYFKDLSQSISATDEGREWHLGLFMAHQWLRFVQNPAPDPSEVLLFHNS